MDSDEDIVGDFWLFDDADDANANYSSSQTLSLSSAASHNPVLAGLAPFRPISDVIARRRETYAFSSQNSFGRNRNPFTSSNSSTVPVAPRPPHGLCGLRNQGATCYLNSLLQALFWTKEFRCRLNALDPERDLGLNRTEDSVVLHMQRDAEEEQNDAPSKTDPATTVPAPQDEEGSLAPVRNSVAWMEDMEDGAEVRSSPVAAETNLNGSTHLFDQLLDLGFSESQIETARRGMRNRARSVDAIVEWIFSHSDGPCADSQDASDRVVGNLFDEHENTAAEAAAEAQLSQDRSSMVDGFSNAERVEFAENSTDAVGDVTAAFDTTQSNGIEHAVVDGPSTSVIAMLPEPSDSTVHRKSRKRVVISELQRLFAWLQLADQQATTTEWLTRAFGWTKGSEVFQQHDVHELNRLLFDAIERSLVRTPQDSLIDDLYHGVVAQRVACSSCTYVSAREEKFLDVPLLVRNMTDICSSLRAFTEQQTLSGENQYFCPECGCKRDAVMGAVFRSLPPVLIFPLLRFEYDWNANKRVKVSSECKFPLMLNMDPYLEGAVTNNSKIACTNGLDHAEVCKILADDGLAGSPLWVQDDAPPNGPNMYILFAVIIHSGGAYGGHYHSYIRVPGHRHEKEPPSGATHFACGHSIDEPGNQWFDFNDSKISAIPEERVSSQYAASDEGAYMLVYRRSDMVADLSLSDSPPIFFAEELDSHNAQLHDDRLEYENELHLLRFSVCLSNDISVEKVDIAGKTFTHLRLAVTPNAEVRPVDIRFDVRQTVSNFICSLNSALGFDDDATASGFTSEDLLYVTELVPNTSTGIFHVVRTVLLDEDARSNRMMDIAFREGTTLLLWNGKTVGGKSWDGCGPEIRIHLQQFVTADEPQVADVQPSGLGEGISNVSTVQSSVAAYAVREFEFVLSETDSLALLYQTIAAKTGVSPSEQYLCRVTRSYNRMTLFRVAAARVEEVSDSSAASISSLFAHGLCDSEECTITVEHIDAEQGSLKQGELANAFVLAENAKASRSPFDQVPRAGSRAKTIFAQTGLNLNSNTSSNSWDVFVEDALRERKSAADSGGCSVEQDTVRVRVEQAAETTVGELKLLILNTLGFTGLTKTEINETRLARFMAGGAIGDSFTEDTSVKSAGIREGDRVVIERGQAPLSTAALRNRIIPTDEMQLRFVIAEQGEVSPSLSKSDEDDHTSYMVLVRRHDLVKVAKGKMLATLKEDTATADEWRLRKTSIYNAPYEQAVTAEQELTRTVEQIGLRENDLLWLERGRAPAEGLIAVRVDVLATSELDLAETGQSHLLMAEHLSPAVIFSNALRLVRSPELSESGVETMRFRSFYRIETLVSMFEVDVLHETLSEFRMRLRASKEWLQYCSTHCIPVASGLRIWRGDTLLRRENTPLKRQGISKDNTNLVLEIIVDEADSNVEGSFNEDSILLFVQEHIGSPDGTSEVTDKHTFSLPPRPLWFEGTTASELRTAIESFWGASPLCIAKLNRFNATWQIVPSFETEHSEDNAFKRCGGGNPLRHKPYYLRDGDVIVVARASYNPALDLPITVEEHVEWFRSLNLQRRRAMRATSNSNAAGLGAGKKRGKKGSTDRGENEGNAAPPGKTHGGRRNDGSSRSRAFEPTLAIDVGDFSD